MSNQEMINKLASTSYTCADKETVRINLLTSLNKASPKQYIIDIAIKFILREKL